MATKYSKEQNEDLTSKYFSYVRAQLKLREAMEDDSRAETARKFAEVLYKRLFDGELEEANNEGFDLKRDDGKQIQVKLVWKADGNPAGLELKPQNFTKPRSRNFDILAVFWIDPMDPQKKGRIKHFVEVTLTELKSKFGTTQKTKQFYPEDFPEQMKASHKRLEAAAKRRGLTRLLNLEEESARTRS